MKQHQGIWLPDHEEHFVEWMTKNGEIVDGRGTYQIKKLRKAMEYVKQFRTAIDIGAHVGLWSIQLAQRFKTVHAFEPVAEHRECWAKNLDASGEKLNEDGSGLRLWPCALGEKEGSVSINIPPGSSGGSSVREGMDTPLRMLDLHRIYDVDFIKLDCEGYELLALRGGEHMLTRYKPCVHVEQKPGKAVSYGLPQTGAVEYLQSLGAKLRLEMSGDFILSWD